MRQIKEQVTPILNEHAGKYMESCMAIANDIEHISTFINESFEHIDDVVMAAAIYYLALMASNEEDDVGVISKKFGVNKKALNAAIMALNDLLGVTIPDDRYSYRTLSEEEIKNVKIMGGISPGEIFVSDLIEYSKDKRFKRIKKKFMKKYAGKYSNGEIDLFIAVNGKLGTKYIIDFYLEEHAFPSWIKNEIKKWKGKAEKRTYVVDEIRIDMCRIFDIPDLEDYYTVKNPKFYKEAKLNMPIACIILPWREHYFFASGEVDILPEKPVKYIPLVKYPIKEMLIPQEEAMRFFAMYITSEDLPGVVQYLLEARGHNILYLMLHDPKLEEIFLKGGPSHEDLRLVAEKLIQVVLYDIKYPSLVYSLIGISISMSMLYVAFIGWLSKIHGIDLDTLGDAMEPVKYDDRAYLKAIYTLKERIPQKEIYCLAASMMVLYAYHLSNGKKVQKINFEAAVQYVIKSKRKIRKLARIFNKHRNEMSDWIMHIKRTIESIVKNSSQ